MTMTKEEMIAKLKCYLNSEFQIKCKNQYDFIEHISANPVGLMHFGNISNGIRGDVLCRILNLTPSYYVNDFGNNYCKFIINHYNNPSSPLTQVYTKGAPLLSEIWDVKEKLYSEAYNQHGTLDRIFNY